MSDWIQTASGRKFYPLDPKPEEVHVEDVAHALAMKCRFAGHCLKFYSVAQHSVLVSRLVPRQDAPWGLLHDAAEAYFADIPRPVKVHPVFAEIEGLILRAVADRFGLDLPEPASVEAADLTLLATERRDLMAPGLEWESLAGVEPLEEVIEAWGWREAKDRFLQRFSDLGLSPY